MISSTTWRHDDAPAATPGGDALGIPMTPDEAMAHVRSWTDSRVVGAKAATTLEILAALGLRIAMNTWPDHISVQLRWSDPITVELTVSSWPSVHAIDEGPEPHLADCMSELANGWSFSHNAGVARLVCRVEDHGTDDA
jgi:hypothetical protein